MDLTIVVLDVGSIQEYVFGSNKIKENVGGSTLVREIFEKSLPEAGKTLFGGKACLDKWEEEPKDVKILSQDIDMETGYIGGGNALLFFRNEDKAKNFIREWAKSLLIHTPGLKTNIAALTISENNLGEGIKNCFNQLVENKMRYAPQVVIPRHGITAECRFTGLSGEIWNNEQQEWMSSVSNARFEASKRDFFVKLFKDVLEEHFEFSTELDKLGQSTGESHIAIVHIDGNGIGQRFQSICEKNTGKQVVIKMRNLAKSVRQATEVSMRALLQDIVDMINQGVMEKIGMSLQKNGDKVILPIRPVILAGDDITFVCEGRLGLYCAEKFIEFINHHASDGLPLTACAGVAIIKTKYPFYRGYQLSEELCHSAKKKAKEDKDSSWLDFHISYGGLSGELDNIRKLKYTTPDGGNLCWRPWRISSNNCTLDQLKRITKSLYHVDSEKWPKSKLMELREVLSRGKADSKKFIQMMKHRDLRLPPLPLYANLPTDGWQTIQGETKTPYFDAIEFGRFFTQELMGEGE